MPDGARPRTPKLNNLPIEAVEYFCRQYAQTGVKSKAANATRSKFGEQCDFPKQNRAFYLFSKTDEGRAMIDAARAEIKEEVKDVPLAHDFGRISLLVEMVEKLTSVLFAKDPPKTGKNAGKPMAVIDRIRLTGEIRECLKEIRRETEPLDYDALRELAPIVALKQLQTDLQKTDPKLAKLVDEGLPAPPAKEPNPRLM